ncbi:YceI family protein [Zavarzinia sp. CC-PAN008]|uniref:YceI family protein n=1 Tax=Zavarzinia sp. CC-PAN008 TaxID=3243332 RepID=UPI003F7458A7
MMRRPASRARAQARSGTAHGAVRAWLAAGALTALALAWATQARAADYTLDPAASSLSFTATAGGAPVEGQFKTFSATIRFDAADLPGSKVEVVIDTPSATTGDAQRDGMLVGGDLFDVANFPQARFATKSFTAGDGGQYQVVADLTIRDVTREVTLPVTIGTSDSGASASGELVIDRLDYGVGKGLFGDESTVAKPVTIRFSIKAGN